MRKTKPKLPSILLVGALTIAASAPVAIRVEVQPQRADGAGTVVVVVIQVSPEDRARIGSNAMARIEIDGEAPPGQSPLWAISLENDGSAEIETTWPPGEHDLRVEIANPSGKDTGLWVGKVRVPDFGASQDVAATPARPTPVPEPAPEPGRGAAAGVAAGAAVTSVPEDTAASLPPEEPMRPPVVPAEEADVGEDISAEPKSPETVPVDKSPVQTETEVQMAADEGTAAEPEIESVTAEAISEADDPAPPEIESETEESTPAEAETATAVMAAGVATGSSTEVTPPPKVDESAAVRETTAPSEPPPIAEPIRSQEAAPAVEPLRGDRVTPTSVLPEPQPSGPSAEVLAAHKEWEDADPESTDLTVVVMRNRQSVPDLGANDLELRVGGSRVPITEIGDAEQAPLLLGVAVDLSDENVGQWGQVSRDLTPLIERAGGGLGRFFVTTTGAESDWEVDPEQAIVTPASGDLAALLRASLGRLDGRRGRAFLLVLTDGRIEPSKEAWRETTAALESAGVPVLVMALWDQGFSKKLRKNLQQITSMSGGRLFMLQALNQMEGAVERFGAVLDAGVALRFETPPVEKGPLQIVVTAPDRTLDISAPRAVR
jgi:hypothetical protein